MSGKIKITNIDNFPPNQNDTQEYHPLQVIHVTYSDERNSIERNLVSITRFYMNILNDEDKRQIQKLYPDADLSKFARTIRMMIVSSEEYNEHKLAARHITKTDPNYPNVENMSEEVKEFIISHYKAHGLL